MQNLNKYNPYLVAIVVFLIAKLLGGTWFVSGFLALSIIFFLITAKKKKKLIIQLIGFIIFGLDLFFIILLFVPVRSYDINAKAFYNQRDNYLKIYVKDPPSLANKMALIIFRKGYKQPLIIRLSHYKKFTKIPVFEDDKLYFLGNKNAKSYVAIYLWDGTILRITPGTKLKLKKIFKNLNNLANSQTEISLENGNIWFHVIKLIKNSSNMKIQTATGQWLIIRGTAGVVSKPQKAKSIAIDYEHFIEVKNQTESKILKPGQAAIIENNKITITDKIQDLLKNIGLNQKYIQQFQQLDKQYFNNLQKQIQNWLKKQMGEYTANFMLKLEELKLKIFSLGNKNYRQYLQNLETYQYLIGKSKQLSEEILNNPNIAFLAANLQKQEAKVAYLYNQLKQNIQNSDLYKTYIINLGIAGKIKDISNQTIQKLEESKKLFNNYLHQFLGK